MPQVHPPSNNNDNATDSGHVANAPQLATITITITITITKIRDDHAEDA